MWRDLLLLRSSLHAASLSLIYRLENSWYRLKDAWPLGKFSHTLSCIKLDLYKSSILQSELICMAGLVLFYESSDETSCSVRTGNSLNLHHALKFFFKQRDFPDNIKWLWIIPVGHFIAWFRLNPCGNRVLKWICRPGSNGKLEKSA